MNYPWGQSCLIEGFAILVEMKNAEAQAYLDQPYVEITGILIGKKYWDLETCRKS